MLEVNYRFDDLPSKSRSYRTPRYLTSPLSNFLEGGVILVSGLTSVRFRIGQIRSAH